jgi:hypothetical protein
VLLRIRAIRADGVQFWRSRINILVSLDDAFTGIRNNSKVSESEEQQVYDFIKSRVDNEAINCFNDGVLVLEGKRIKCGGDLLRRAPRLLRERTNLRVNDMTGGGTQKARFSSNSTLHELDVGHSRPFTQGGWRGDHSNRLARHDQM